MADNLIQEGRIAVLSTPLGKDRLAITALDATEGLSELFEFRVEAVSADANIDFDRLLGCECAVSLSLLDRPKRFFSGVAAEAQATGSFEDLFVYRLVLRPALWLLTRTTNCRIFHRKTALAIVTDVLGERNVSIENATKRSYPELDYCVQYRETDFDFVSRLMEQHGIYYYFKHSDGAHKLVLADSRSSHEPIAGGASIAFANALAGLTQQEQALHSWSSERRFRTGKIELRDYAFREPGANLKTNAQGSERYAKATAFEYYDYPGKYEKTNDGRLYADARLEAEQAIDYRRYASGEAANLFPGGLAKLDRHPAEAENKQYLVVRCAHHFADEAFRAAAALGGGRPYLGNYELQPADRVFRAPIVTPRPLVHGPQTAKVVARGKDADSEEIDTDPDGHGMIKVRFHWDREDKRSCWMRVAQLWSGPGWGAQFIPRIGMEVVVEFLEGDPDKPIVVGAVYNGGNKFPYKLPDNNTQSGLKSDSSKGHGGYNELMFEDKKDGEKIRMHAEKDHEVVIRNSETVEIGENFSGGGASRKTTLKQGGDELTLQSGSRSATIHGGKDTTTVDQSIKIESLGDTITLTTGASSIKLTPSKIEISSTMIALSAAKIDLN
ncbi:type VI secretion system Vgr family protein [Methylosinus sp. Ce-a6]|uniref:type VI secretion system Vgr family protein n=1 Tax=Methylosinus sp. Ce-a6 TaxID=2172005 RepID=UPI00135886F1|nr:type VI secretion system tip protein TssI/VgrG [Methylosinus sp. Ce-a6]